MKFKRFMALALAGVMTLGMSMSAFAEGEDKSTPLDETVTVITKDLNYDTAAVTTVNQEFTFKFVQDKKVDGKPENLASVAIGDKKATFTNNTQQEIKLALEEINNLKKVPGIYTYSVTEETKDDPTDGFGVFYDTTKENANKYKLYVFVKKGEQGNTATYYLQKADESKSAKIAYKNMYKPKAGEEQDDKNISLEISKKVENEEWATQPDYEFTINFADGDATYTTIGEDGKETTKKIAEVAADGYEAVKVKADGTSEAAGKIKSGDKFKLAKDEKIQFKNIPAGIKYTVTETKDPAQKSMTIKLNGADANEVKDQVLKAGSANTAEFTNKYETIDMTGVALNIAPFVAMVAAVAGAVALYIAARRRVR